MATFQEREQRTAETDKNFREIAEKEREAKKAKTERLRLARLNADRDLNAAGSPRHD